MLKADPAALDVLGSAGMGHLGTDDVLLVAEGDGIDAMPHTPRHEPSWFYQEVPSEMIDQCLRPRSRGGIDEAAALWLHKHLVALGHAANARSCHFMAHSWFECAYGLKDSTPELISSINMRLRLGQATLAKQLYERVLQQREVALIYMLTDAQREVATRKLLESKAAIAARAAGASSSLRDEMQDEMQQLLAPDGISLEPADIARAVPLMRKQGHRANSLGDCEAAQLWFDCAFALSQQTVDLLSAANMRQKLVVGSPLAEALYRHVLAIPQLPVRELLMAERKLQLLQQASSAAIAYGGNVTAR